MYIVNQTIKELIRLNIKPNFAALSREYGCDYRTDKIRKHIIDEYKEIIINKLETISGITAYSIYYFLKVEKKLSRVI